MIGPTEASGGRLWVETTLVSMPAPMSVPMSVAMQSQHEPGCVRC